ncbi:MAG: hypothetical protein AAGF31_07835 [Planctomycetota bacterium]
MHALAKSSPESSLARTVAPEDIARGDYVAILSVEHEYPLLVWLCDPPLTQQDEVVCIRQRTDLCRDPLKVCDICLPFVSVKRPSGERATLDVRSCELARLDPGYGKRVWRAQAPKKKKGKRRK